jgi:(S)-beta-tyrosine adenylation enzyme
MLAIATGIDQIQLPGPGLTKASSAHRLGIKNAVTSCTQDGLWYLHLVDPESAAHNVFRAYRVSGDLDLEALRAAWHALVNRHEVLRTTIVEHDGQPVQQIEVRSTAEVSIVDASRRPQLADRVVTELAGAPIRLAEGPIARPIVIQLGPTEQILLLVAHQAIIDEESMSILVDQLSTAYAAAIDGRLDVPVIQLPYAGYARWQREQLDTPEHQAALDRWTAELSPPPPPLTLPTDRPRPAGPSHRGGVLRFDWSELGGAPPDVVLAAYQVLLHRLSGEDRISVGVTTVARPEHAATVGAYGNLLAMGADFTERPTFREHVARIGREAPAVPFDQLVGTLSVDRDPRRIPLSDAVFVLRDGPAELRLPGAEVSPLTVDTGSVWADLTLTIDGTGSGVAGSLSYRDSLFDRDSATQILEQLRTLLVAALAEPDLPVSELPLESEDRIHATVRNADRITGADLIGMTVNELVHEQDPDAVAVVADGAAVSYRELLERASVVTGLVGAVAGQAVAVRIAQGPSQLAALIGVLDAGAHVVCLGTGDTGERGQAILSDLQPVSMVVDAPPAGDELNAWYREELGGRVIDIAVERADGSPPLPGLLDGRAYVAYTSGSTGRPKGIPTSHASFAQFVSWVAGEFGIGPGSRVAQWAASGYDASLVEAFAALTAGATLHPVPEKIRAHPEKLVDWLTSERITLFQTVPSFAREILRAASSRAGALGSLDHLLLAGEALPVELANGLLAELPGVRLINLYGPTESILATWHEVTGPRVGGTTPIGGSIPGRQVLVLDEHDRPCPTGVTGQIVIHSPYVTAGYVGAAAGEHTNFRPLTGFGHCYRTGDLGRLRWDGSLEFLGRKDFQVKFQGIRVELTDIEAAIAEHSSVAECAVVAGKNADGLVNRLVAYVVPVRGPDGKATGSAEDWRAALSKRFGKSKFPVSFKTMIGLPRNNGGKVDRRGLPDPGPAPRGNSGPSTSSERAMAAVWSELLGVEQNSTDDTFFAAGGHSLLLPLLLDRIREHFGVQLSIWDYFANPTIAGLSALVDSQSASPEAVNETMIG